MSRLEIPKYRRPSTPGEIIRGLFLEDEDFDFTQGQVADHLGVSRQNFTAVLNGRRAVDPLMAMRLERVVGLSAQTWLDMQLAVDIYDAMRSPEAKQIAKLKPIMARKPHKRSRAA
jgi:addiction module HigA family antidote